MTPAEEAASMIARESALATMPHRPPTASEQRAFVAAVAVYALIVLAVLPVAQEAAPTSPRIAAVYGVAVLVSDACTALVLAGLYLGSGRSAFLILAAAYLYSALMSAVHMAVFPGAVFTERLFGGEQTIGWQYLAWRGGAVIGYLAAVVAAGSPRETPEAVRWRDVALAVLIAVCAAGALSVFSAFFNVESLSGRRFTTANIAIQWGCVVVCAAALALLVRRRAFGQVFYWWLALVLIGTIADLSLSNLGGARYSLGWHTSRATLVVSALLLLAFLVSEVSAAASRSPPWRVATYGAALAVILAAVLLRWFLDQWLGHGVPFITLYPGVAVAVWLCGWRPTTMAVMVGTALAYAVYFAPGTQHAAATLQLVLFLGSSFVIIALGESLRRARDRTRASEAALLKQASELQRADANKSQFLALLAHELRNPLAPLRTGLAVLKVTPDAGTAAQTREMMERQIGHLTRLIDDLLDVSRIDRGKLDMKPERVSVDALVRTAVETAMPGIDAKGLRLVVTYAGQPLYVRADPVRLTQVFANLLNNAAKFTPPQGRIELSMHAEHGEAVVMVTDTGIGIEREHLESVFEMFMQVESARSAATGGLGLGLTVVRSIVERHGGRVSARSAGVGQGAEFEVRLPLDSATESPVKSLTPPVVATVGRRILVVDDNVDAAATLAVLLRLEGHRVETSNDGESALRSVATARPDVAFIDLNMPGMDGCTLGERLRALPATRGITLVALTGMGQEADVARTRKAGFDAHLTKPADPELVLRLAAGDGAEVLPLRRDRS